MATLPDNYEPIEVTVSTETAKIYIEWDFTITELFVWQQNTTTGVIKKESEEDFAISEDEDGGGVFILVENPDFGTSDPEVTIYVVRQSPREQDYDAAEAERINPEALTTGLNDIVKMIQEIENWHGDDPTLQPIVSVNPFEIPDSITRADTIFGFDSSGDPTFIGHEVRCETLNGELSTSTEVDLTDNIWVFLGGTDMRNVSIDTLRTVIEVGTSFTEYAIPVGGDAGTLLDIPDQLQYDYDFYAMSLGTSDAASSAYRGLSLASPTTDDISIAFDAYYNGSWNSSDDGSNYRLNKSSDQFALQVSYGTTSGTAITWADLFRVTSEYFTIGQTFNSKKFRVSSENSSTALVINQDGDIGFGTSAPGAEGCALFEFFGQSDDEERAPATQWKTSSSYIELQIKPVNHDDIEMNWDACRDGVGDYISQDPGSNYGIHKNNDLFKLVAAGGVAAGSPLSWTIGLQMDISGNVTIPVSLTSPEITSLLATQPTTDQKAAMDAATTPSGANPFLTALDATSGEANTASNVGGFAGVFKQKTGVDLEFRSLRSPDASLTITENTSDVSISITQKTLNPEALFHVRDEKAQGTVGQTLTATTQNVREITTVISNTLAGASLASNQVTLPAGKYWVKCKGRYQNEGNVGASIFSLYNVTDAVYVDSDTDYSQYDFTGGSVNEQKVAFDTKLTITSSKVFELHHYVGNTTTTGSACNVTGFTEKYLDAQFWYVGTA